MEQLSFISYGIILFFLWMGHVRNKMIFYISCLVSLLPLSLGFYYYFYSITLNIVDDTFALSPIVLLGSYYWLNRLYIFLYNMKPDPGNPFDTRAKYSNRKLNFGDYIVYNAPILISFIPMCFRN